MNPPESLLQAAHRDVDPTAALACADWYDEHDQPDQARLMRVSVKLEQLEPGHPDALAIELEAEKVRFRREWERQIAGVDSTGLSGRVGIERPRGLLGWCFGQTLSKLVAEVTPWFDRTTVRGVRVSSIGPYQLANLLRSSVGERLVRLQIRPKRDGTDACLRVLAKFRNRLNLSEWGLDLSQDRHGLTASSPWQGLSASDRFRLNSGGEPFAVVLPLLLSPSMRELKHVSLQANYSGRVGINRAELMKLGDPTQSPSLRSWSTHGYRYPKMALTAFAQSDLWPDLESIEIQGRLLDRATIQPLASRLNRKGLRSLRLFGIIRGSQGADFDFFRAAGDTLGLRQLAWTADATMESDVPRLAAWPGLTTVTDLRLGFRWIASSQLRVLIQSPFAGALQRLTLDTPLTESCLEALSEGAQSDSIRSLSLGLRDISERAWESMIRMLHSSGFSRLQILSLNSEIGSEEVTRLATHLDLPDLERLQLQLYALDQVSLRTLLESPRLPRLAIVNLEDVNQMLDFWTFELPEGWHFTNTGTLIHPERLR